MESKIIPLEDAEGLGTHLKKLGMRVVSTNGCFDILHWGHLQYLQEARALGDKLVVGINSDESVRRLKGPSRPIFSEDVRARQLAALQCVDYVVIFGQSTPEVLLARLKPDVHAKGGDYKVEELPETAVVRENGGDVKCLSLVDGYSTTEIIEKLKLLPDEHTPPNG